MYFDFYSIMKYKEGLMRLFSKQLETKKRLEKTSNELEKASQRLEFVNNFYPGFLWETNSNGCYIYVDTKIKNILGYAAHELIGEYRQVRELDEELISRFSLEGNAVDLNDYFSLPHKDGHLIVIKSHQQPLLNDLGECIGYRGYDINMHANNSVEDQIKTAKKLVEPKHKDNALLQAETIVKELMTEANIVLRAFTMRFRFIQKDELKELSNQSQLAIKGASHTAQTILQIFRNIELYFKIRLNDVEIRFKVLKLNEFEKFIDDLFNDAQSLAFEKKLGFSIHYATNLPEEISCDQDLLGMALSQIVNNATKYTNKGCIKINIDSGNFRGDMSSPQIRFVIEDNGIGIPKENLENVFDPFNQQATAEVYGGNGIGLYISKSIVELLGGQINLSSKDGLGTIFTILVPAQEN